MTKILLRWLVILHLCAALKMVFHGRKSIRLGIKSSTSSVVI